MNPKHDLTKIVLNALNLSSDEESIRKHTILWWINPRPKAEGGLRLTKDGFAAFEKADIKIHKIRLSKEMVYTNQIIIWLDNYIDCPWFIDNRHIYILGEKMAIQLVLFSGDIEKFVRAKANKLQTP